MANNDQPAAGHNLPSLTDILAPDVIEALIEADTAPLKQRAEDLRGSCMRFVAAHPAITTDEQDGIAAAVLAQCARFTAKSGRVELARTALKAPVLAASKTIDAAYPPIARIVTDATAPVAKASIAYKTEKDRIAYAAARAEAKRRTEEAEAAERLASAGSGMLTYADAAVAYGKADAAQQVADAKPAERTRSFGDEGGVSSLRYKPDLSKLMAAAGKAGGPIPVIPGVKIEDVRVVSVLKASDVPQIYCTADLTVRQ